MTAGLSPKLIALAAGYREWILNRDALLTEIENAPLPVRRTRLDRELTAHIELDGKRPPLNSGEIRQLVSQLVNEMAGFGPLDPLLQDPEITEIMVNGHAEVWVERNGKLSLARGVQFGSEKLARHVAQTIVAPLGRRLDDVSPLVDGRLPDGSRVNVIIAPLSLRGTCMTIRRFRAKPWNLADLLTMGTLTQGMADLLEACVVARLNMVISGGTSSGKTSLLSALGRLIPEGERVITIEDVAELRFEHAHVIPLESRPANVEGRGEVPIRLLVKNALRMRPDRIVVGEVRGGEVVDMFQAANTGHRGTLTTGHANSAQDMLSRLETLVLQSGDAFTSQTIRETMLPVFEVIVHAARLDDGSRRLMGIYALTRDGAQLIPRPMYEFRQTGFRPDGTVEGQHVGPLFKPAWWDDAMSALARRRRE